MQIEFKNLSFSYSYKTPFEVKALKNINLLLNENNITAIVGKTGSGKSTLTQFINYFLIPNEGEAIINEFVNKKKTHHSHKDVSNLRKDIGFLFQFSENQLFEETVLKDVYFGIRNFYPKETNYEQLAKDALKLVGLGEEFYNRSPFDLSGGEKKRVAIAGVLAYKPKLLILDEPTAGLDANGKKEIMNLFKKIHESGVAIILISHDMDIVLDYANKMIIIDDGEIKKIGTPKEILKEDVERYNLETPNIFKFIHALNSKGMNIPSNVDNIDDLIKELKHHG